MTKRALEVENKELKEENFLLKAENEQLKKMMFAAKRERYVSDQDPGQGSLFDTEPVEEQSQVEEQVVPVKKKKKLKKIVQRNTFPAHLPRQTQVIEPEGLDLEQTIKIGEDVTELLAYTPGSIHVKQIIRPRRVHKDAQDKGVAQANIPLRLIPKGMVDESLIAHLMVEKILFHTPLFRLHKKLKQAGVDFLAQQNLYNWFHDAAANLLPLIDLFKADLLAQDYLQCDETRIQVLSKNKPGASLRGQMWVINQPQLQAVLFEYHPSRSTNAAQSLLQGFKGILQVDGYSAYERLANHQPIELIFCMAHARRKFYDAQNTDPPRAEYFLHKVQQLYQIERQARQDKLQEQQRYQLRQDSAVPILQELGDWLKEQLAQVLPKSPIGKAIAYNGQLEIDNNLVENRIRPVALGRKNYLFAKTDQNAAHLAYLYSIIGTADKYGFNQHRYITWLLRQVATNKITDQAIQWLPHRMPNQQAQQFLD